MELLILAGGAVIGIRFTGWVAVLTVVLIGTEACNVGTIAAGIRGMKGSGGGDGGGVVAAAVGEVEKESSNYER